MTQPFPTWEQKTEALRDAIAWAAKGICGDWRYKKEAFSLPDDNDPWFELAMGRMLEIGVDEIRSEDNIDPTTGNPYSENPRLDSVYSQRQFMIEARFFSRDQEHDTVAWLIADRARSRLRFPYVRERFLKPVGIAIVELLQAIPMPSPRKVIDMRWQSEAVIEMEFFTTLREVDEAAVGTWIETVEVSSVLRNPGGVPLDPKLQLDNEVMP
jgi:hypothetical protein